MGVVSRILKLKSELSFSKVLIWHAAKKNRCSTSKFLRKKNTLVLSMSRNSRKKRLESRNLLAKIDMLRCACQKSKLPKTPVSIKILPSDWSLFVKIRCVPQMFHISHYLCVAACASKTKFARYPARKCSREATRMAIHSPLKSGNASYFVVFCVFFCETVLA